MGRNKSYIWSNGQIVGFNFTDKFGLNGQDGKPIMKNEAPLMVGTNLIDMK